MNFTKNKVSLALIAFSILTALFLRTYGLTQFPPSLYWEEVALGYDAYSVLKTGADHHGNYLPVVAFESFGDWKPSVYFYALIPFIATFGLTEWAVRLPAVISGLAIVLSVGLLAKSFDTRKKEFAKMSLIGLAIAAISPWAVMFSRAAWEVNLATALLSWGMVTGLWAVSQKTKQLRPVAIISTVFLLVLSTYTYHGTRLIAPLLGIGMATYWWSQVKTKSNWLKSELWKFVLAAVIGVVMISPLLVSLNSPQVKQRFAETSIFSDLDIIIESNARKEQSGNSLYSRIFYHRYLLFSREVTINYLDHFNLDFLFISGDINPRHSTGYVGLFYHVDFIFLVLGGWWLFKKLSAKKLLLLWWIIVAIFPAAMTKTTPHALRILPALPALLILLTFGIKEFIQLKEDKVSIVLNIITDHIKITTNLVKAVTPHLIKLIYLSLIFIYLLELSFFWRHYSLIYPQQYASEWQYGYKEMILELNKEMKERPELPVYITREQGRPAMYYWFFSKTDPRQVQSAQANSKKDQGEFLEFKKITFVGSLNEVKAGPAIVVASVSEMESLADKNTYQVTSVQSIKDVSGDSVWEISTIK
jgi:4-amino-4-deoxy-L-arabinose transferase-like glycosyltransferase